MKISSFLFPLLILWTSFLNISDPPETMAEVQIVEDYQNINTFEDLVALFPGKVVYVDMWATWCGPCRKEFSHSAKLHEFAEGKDIEFVYISLDKVNNTNIWKNFIHRYKIAGHHILANEALRENLRENHYSAKENGVKNIYMPSYIITNKKGEVFYRDARRPSEGKRLYRQLGKALDK